LAWFVFAAVVEMSIEPEQFVDAGDRVGRVLRMSVRGEGSGLELDHHLHVSHAAFHRSNPPWPSYLPWSGQS
jgi:hypothetical protein